jgi:hypothetical protein
MNAKVEWLGRVEWLGDATAGAEVIPVSETPTAVPVSVPVVPSMGDPACLAQCEKNFKEMAWDPSGYATCVAVCASATPAPAPGGTPGTPAPPPEKKTPWGWVVLGGLAVAGAAWLALRGGGVADNPYPWTPSLPQGTSAKLRLYRVGLNQGGYDARGRYWGTGQPLYFAEDDDGNHRALRASSREEAKRQFPNAKWYRD